MSDRVFRLISGLALWAILLFSIIYQNNSLLIAFCILYLLEGITNWRIPLLISRIRFGKDHQNNNKFLSDSCSDDCSYNIVKSTIFRFEAERVMRFVVVLFLLVSYFTFPDVLWFFPWYVAGMLIVSGITNICPILMFLRWIGFQ